MKPPRRQTFMHNVFFLEERSRSTVLNDNQKQPTSTTSDLQEKTTDAKKSIGAEDEENMEHCDLSFSEISRISMPEASLYENLITTGNTEATHLALAQLFKNSLILEKEKLKSDKMTPLLNFVKFWDHLGTAGN